MHARLCLSHRTQCRPWRRGGMAMGVRTTYVTSRMDTQMLSRLSTGASHKRGCTVEKRAPTGCDVSEQLARIMRCNSIPLCMPDAGGATEFVARGSLVHLTVILQYCPQRALKRERSPRRRHRSTADCLCCSSSAPGVGTLCALSVHFREEVR